MIEVNEFNTAAYGPRTKHNASSAQLTCAFAVDMFTAGEILTKKCAGLKYLGFDITRENIHDPAYYAEWSGKIKRYIKNNKVKTINVAGNGVYTLIKHGISQQDVNELLYKLIKELKETTELQFVVSGGQTGVDIEAAVACYKLDFPCVITLPKGFTQRHEDGVDVNHTRQEIEESIILMSSQLDKPRTLKP